MRALLIAGIMVAAGLLCADDDGIEANEIDGGRFGRVQVMVPSGEIRGLVLLFADASSPGRDQAVIEHLRRVGAMVARVDTAAYALALLREAKGCQHLVGDVEALAQRLEHLHPTRDYFYPILMGTGEAGTLAYATLAQAPPATLAEPSRSIRLQACSRTQRRSSHRREWPPAFRRPGNIQDNGSPVFRQMPRQAPGPQPRP